MLFAAEIGQRLQGVVDASHFLAVPDGGVKLRGWLGVVTSVDMVLFSRRFNDGNTGAVFWKGWTGGGGRQALDRVPPAAQAAFRRITALVSRKSPKAIRPHSRPLPDIL